jgi:hypothetical protein
MGFYTYAWGLRHLLFYSSVYSRPCMSFYAYAWRLRHLLFCSSVYIRPYACCSIQAVKVVGADLWLVVKRLGSSLCLLFCSSD